VTKPDPKARIARWRRDMGEFGDVRFSEAIAKSQKPPGRPQRWSRSACVNIFLVVEAIKKPGRGGTARAWEAVAKFYGLGVEVVALSGDPTAIEDYFTGGRVGPYVRHGRGTGKRGWF